MEIDSNSVRESLKCQPSPCFSVLRIILVCLLSVPQQSSVVGYQSSVINLMKPGKDWCKTVRQRGLPRLSHMLTGPSISHP